MKIKIIDFGYKQKPTRKHYNDAGADVYLLNDIKLTPNETIAIPLGFGVEIPDGYVGFIITRSSIAKSGIVVHIPPIDSGYRGQIHAVVSNLNKNNVSFKEGDRIGQLVIMPCILVDLVEDFDEERGTGAFGSTGK